MEDKHLKIIDWLLKKVCPYYMINPEQAFSKSRKREIVYARRVIYYFLYEFNNITSRILATHFHQDHATIFTTIKEFGNMYDTDKNFKQFIDTIKDEYFAEFGNTKIYKKQYSELTNKIFFPSGVPQNVLGNILLGI
jgi:hypothetical protein